MADGTPLESLETGEVQNTADAARMQEIMNDINQPSGAQSPMGALPSMQQSPGPMRPMLQQPPMYNPTMQFQQQQQYVPVEEEDARPTKKNVWSSIFDRLRDPLVVAILMFVLSLPVLHTQLAKVIPWAFAVGGQLSWLGLGTLSLFAGVSFGAYRGIYDLVG
jgi:hypothetical protein